MFVQRPPGSQTESLGRLYLSDSQRDVIATLRRGLLRPRAVVAVSGDAGLGKSTVVGAVMAELGEPVRSVTVPRDDALSALSDLQASTSPASGGILVVDDAHHLSPEQLTRLVAALDQAPPNPARLVLVMQSTFWTMMGSPALAAVRDRIDTRAVLFPMSYNEAEQYIEHLFGLAGTASAKLLSREALHGLILRAQGNPQQLNVELDRALRGTAALLPLPQASLLQAWGEKRAADVSPAPGAPRRVGRIVSAGLAVGAVGLALWATMLPFAPSAPQRESDGDAPALAQVRAPVLAPIRAAADPAERPALPPFSPATLPPPAPASPAGPVLAAAAEPPTADPPATVDLALDLSAPALMSDGSSNPAAEEVEAAAPLEVETTAIPEMTERLAPEMMALLLRRGEEMLALHDISAARRLFERAARAGSATAAFTLGTTYDRQHLASATDADAGSTRRWYTLAAERGDQEARRRLDRLDSAKVAR